MEIVKIELNKLRTHERNQEYFEDMTGLDFEGLKKSIAEQGIIEPLIVTKNKDTSSYKILCGNQRYRACKELGIDVVPCIIRDVHDSDEEVRILIEDNLIRRHLTIQQRAKLMAELYNMSKKKTNKEKLQEISEKTELSPRQIQKYIKINNNLIEQFYVLLNEGAININTCDEIATHSPEVQYELYNAIKDKTIADAKKTINAQLQQIKELINKNKSKEEQIKKMEQEVVEHKNFLKVKGIEPDSVDKEGEIVRDIIAINYHILNLIKKCVNYSLDMKKLGFTDKNIELDSSFFSVVTPPVYPVFKVDLQDIANYIELSVDEKKYEEVLEEHVLKFLE